ncbi:MAG: ATP-binding cassette domain-containing protein [Holdemanella porci]
MEILKVEGVSKQIKNRKILDNISFSIFENEIVGLIGPNGAGKSTIMKCVTGLYHMNEGKITICGYDLKERFIQCVKKYRCKY